MSSTPLRSGEMLMHRSLRSLITLPKRIPTISSVPIIRKMSAENEQGVFRVALAFKSEAETFVNTSPGRCYWWKWSLPPRQLDGSVRKVLLVDIELIS